MHFTLIFEDTVTVSIVVIAIVLLFTHITLTLVLLSPLLSRLALLALRSSLLFSMLFVVNLIAVVAVDPDTLHAGFFRVVILCRAY